MTHYSITPQSPTTFSMTCDGRAIATGTIDADAKSYHDAARLVQYANIAIALADVVSKADEIANRSNPLPFLGN